MSNCQKIRLLNLIISGFTYGLLQVYFHSGYNGLEHWEKLLSYGLIGLSLSLSRGYCWFIKHKQQRDGIYFWTSLSLILSPTVTLLFSVGTHANYFQ